MNRFVDILNRIREHVNLNWLTPSQTEAYHILCERLKFLDEVNLWGEHGVGKTFIGWFLYKQGLAAYEPCLGELGQVLPTRRTIVVDNLDWRRSAVRDILHQCTVVGYERIVLITAEPVQEQIAGVELRLTMEDIATVVRNLRSVGVPAYSDNPRDLWDLVSPLRLKE